MKYFRLISIMAMALSLRDLFKLSEEDAIYVLVTYVNSCGGSVT